MREHTSQQHRMAEHIGRENHKIKEEEVKIIARESNTWCRKIRKVVEIRTHKPEINRDNGYDLPARYKKILQPHLQGVRDKHVLKA